MNVRATEGLTPGAGRPAEKAAGADGLIKELRDLELSSDPAKAMLKSYRGILDRAKRLPAPEQWRVTYQAIATLTAIENAQDAPKPIRAIDRFMRRMVRVLGSGGIDSLLNSMTRGGPRLHAGAETALARITRAAAPPRIFSVLESTKDLLPKGTSQAQLLVGDAKLTIERGSKGNQVRFEGASGKPLDQNTLLSREGERAPHSAQAFAHLLRHALVAQSRTTPPE